LQETVCYQVFSRVARKSLYLIVPPLIEIHLDTINNEFKG
jgi:hypothetical protein